MIKFDVKKYNLNIRLLIILLKHFFRGGTFIVGAESLHTLIIINVIIYYYLFERLTLMSYVLSVYQFNERANETFSIHLRLIQNFHLRNFILLKLQL